MKRRLKRACDERQRADPRSASCGGRPRFPALHAMFPPRGPARLFPTLMSGKALALSASSPPHRSIRRADAALPPRARGFASSPLGDGEINPARVPVPASQSGAGAACRATRKHARRRPRADIHVGAVAKPPVARRPMNGSPIQEQVPSTRFPSRRGRRIPFDGAPGWPLPRITSSKDPEARREQLQTTLSSNSRSGAESLLAEVAEDRREAAAERPPS